MNMISLPIKATVSGESDPLARQKIIPLRFFEVRDFDKLNRI